MVILVFKKDVHFIKNVLIKRYFNFVIIQEREDRHFMEKSKTKLRKEQRDFKNDV
jgi:hypothetical protein